MVHDLFGLCAQIQEQWYRLGSYQARFAAADALQEALGARMAGVDLGDDGTLTFDEKLWIFGKFYAKCVFQPCTTDSYVHI